MSGWLGQPLPPRLDLERRSPTGFNWGYGGSGPSQLALAILCHLKGDAFALRNYQQLKSDIIAGLDQDKPWFLPRDELLAWVDGVMRAEADLAEEERVAIEREDARASQDAQMAAAPTDTPEGF